MWSWSVVALFVLNAVPYISSEGYQCERLGPCSCAFPNGTGVDLSPSNRTLKAGPLKFFSYNQDNGTNVTITTVVTYYFFPCEDNVLKLGGLIAPAGCNTSLAICREEIKETKIPVPDHKDQFTIAISYDYEKYGTNIETTFDNKALAIVYANKPSTTTVLLVCAPNADSTSDTFTVDESDPKDVKFSLYSANACLHQIKDVSTRSTGSTLLIIFFTLALLYLVLGVCTKKFLMGAQGVEVIPNVSFWRDLPALCRDGWLFVRNGCKVPTDASVGPAARDPNSYDTI